MGKLKVLEDNKLATAFDDSADNLKSKVLDVVGTIDAPLDNYLDSIKNLGDDPATVDPVALTNPDAEDVMFIQGRIANLLAAVKVKTDQLNASNQAMLKQVLTAIAANIP